MENENPDLTYLKIQALGRHGVHIGRQYRKKPGRDQGQFTVNVGGVLAVGPLDLAVAEVYAKIREQEKWNDERAEARGLPKYYGDVDQDIDDFEEMAAAARVVAEDKEHAKMFEGSPAFGEPDPTADQGGQAHDGDDIDGEGFEATEDDREA